MPKGRAEKVVRQEVEDAIAGLRESPPVEVCPAHGKLTTALILCLRMLLPVYETHGNDKPVVNGPGKVFTSFRGMFGLSLPPSVCFLVWLLLQ